MNAYEILAAAIRQISPEDARRELGSTDEQLAARLSEIVGAPVAARCDFVRMTKLALRLAAKR